MYGTGSYRTERRYMLVYISCCSGASKEEERGKANDRYFVGSSTKL
jgi:hypothetical protein